MADGVRVNGDKKLARGLARFNGSLAKRMRPRITRAGLFVAREAQKRIRGSRKTNPEDLLGVVTGRLRGSILSKVSSDGFSATVGTNVEYARKHEFGIGVKQRAYLAPALEASKDFILKEVGAGVDAALKDI